MPHYRYRAKDPAGRTTRKTRFAESEMTLIKALRSEGFVPLEIRPAAVKPGRIRLGMNDARELSAMLALLLDSGHTVPDALDLVIKVKQDGRIGRACEAWSRELDRGASFRQALDSAPVALPAGFRSLTGIGETVGSLGSVLERLGEYYGRLAKLRERLGTALIYPCLVLVVAIIVAIIVATVILPKMAEMLIVLNPDTVATSEDPRGLTGLFIGIAVLFGAPALVLSVPRESTLGRWRSRALLALPLIGPFIRDWGLLGWSFALEILSAGGVPMNQSLAEAAGAAGNPRLVSVLAELSGQLGKGHSLAALLAVTPYVPSVVPAWVSIGERTGKDTEVFKPIRRYFEERVSRSIDLATQLMEPVLILALGAGMVFFVLRYLMPFFRMMGNLV